MFKWSSQTTFLTLVGMVALMVFSVTIFSLGYLTGQSLGANRVIADARQKLSQVLPSAPAEVYSVSGTVKHVGSDQLVIAANPISANPLDAQGPSERTIHVTPGTVLQQIVFKTAVQVQQDNANYRAQLDAASKAGSTPPSAPLPYTVATLTLNDFAVGDMVVVNAKDNIRDSADITATEVNRTQKAQ